MTATRQVLAHNQVVGDALTVTQPPTLSPTPETTTLAPTPEPTTLAPTPEPTTEQSTPEPTTVAPTPEPTTLAPTPEPTTLAPTPAPTTPSTLEQATLTPTPSPTSPIVCESPRVRRPWGSLGQADKILFLDAINASISSGYHALFTEVHSEESSGNEAHRTCGMIFWHRRFLLAYENMLRSLEPRFACITIPYWDFFTDYSNSVMLNSSTYNCASFEACASILTDFGSSLGPATTLSINGISTTGNCVSSGPLSNFCQSSTLSGTACSNCIPRDSWLAKPFPSGFASSTIAKYISLSYGYAWFSQNVHYYIHNAMHNALGSTFATMATSADPLFYTFHSTIDVIHQLYYECQVGRPMTDTEKKTSIYAFQSCSMTSGVTCPNVNSSMTMFWKTPSRTKIAAESHPLLAPFFSTLPSQYWQYVTTTDLGSNAYTYEKDVLLTLINSNKYVCPKNKIRRQLTTASKDRRTQAAIKSFNLFQKVFDHSFAEVPSKADAFEQVELMECAYYYRRHGSIDDFSPTFRHNFGLSSTSTTLCKQRMYQLRSGDKEIRLDGWEEVFDQYLQVQ